MQCLIIAAGQGSRLRSKAPSKPLVEIADRPLIEHVVRRARAGGASSFLIVTGYAGEGVEAFLSGLASREGLAIECVRNEEWQRPNGVSVAAAAGRLEAHFLLLMSDHLFDPEMVAATIAAEDGGDIVLAVDRRLDNGLVDIDDVTKVETEPGGRIVRLGKAIERYDAFDTGVFRCTPALVAAIEESVSCGGQGSLSEGVQRLADQRRAFALDIGARWWLDVDDPRALALAQAELGGAKKLIS
ncbi:MAG TPA: NTP transferase domain-containing protein [Allosphingosinicella sp.]|nr:NTP transferase domain-containing protein [Allosphingosinicella sp.]